MRLIRAVFLFLAVCLPTTWTLAHADEGMGGAAGETKPKKKSKKKSKDTSGAAGAPGDADKK
jgi:hypothetical protein